MNEKPLILLSAPFFGGNESKYLNDCMDSGWISSAGSYVKKLEETISDYVNSNHAVSCVNGTAALHLCLIACGIQANDEVIVPTLTFIAPVNTIKYVNAHPVFMDCDDYLNMDVEKLDRFLHKECTFDGKKLVNKTTGRQVKAIIPVHIFGSLCNMERIMELAEKFSLKVIEDATEALGSYFTQGRYTQKFAGTVGHMGCYSFNGNKIITCGGGGMIVTNNQDFAEKVNYLSTQAKSNDIDYIHDEVGYNYRLTALQAAVGLAQLEQLEDFIKNKQENYKYYKEQIEKIPGLTLLDTPNYCRSNYWFYSLQVDESIYGKSQQQLLEILNSENIQTRPIWKLNHTQKPYRYCQAYDIEKAVNYQETILNIPCSVNITKEEMDRVILSLRANIQK